VRDGMKTALVIPALALLAGLAAAGTWSVRIGLADAWARQETIAATNCAIALVPDAAEYRIQLAELSADENPQVAEEALRRAVALNPWDSPSWIALGLRAERNGDQQRAEQDLLRAASVERGFQPQWTLASYYLRHQDMAAFWTWAKGALEIGSVDPRPIFQLCGRVNEDGRLLDRLDIRSPATAAAYVAYLLDQKQVDFIGPAMGRVLAARRPEDLPVLLTLCDRLLESAHVDEAASLWDQLAERGAVPSRKSQDVDQLLVDPNFASPPSPQGFGWRLSVTKGVDIARDGDSQGLRITFSGSQPEAGEAVGQWVQVQGNSSYDLRCAYRTNSIASHAGIFWRITDRNGAVLRDGQSLTSAADAEQVSSFETPPACRLVRLSLWYQRMPGTTRPEGDLFLKRVTMRPADQAPARGSRVKK